MAAKTKQHGFTLLELLVVMAIIALLMAILLPAMSAGRRTVQFLECKTKLRAVTTEFTFFADESGGARRGNSEKLGPNRFRIEDFQESIYKIDEFWDSPSLAVTVMKSAEQPMMCPAVSSRLERRANIPCSSGAVGPARNVSIAFNKRLETKTFYYNGNPFPAVAILTPNILHHPNVPLIIDVDGQAADDNGKRPYYTAPPILDDKEIDIYESGNFWFPSFRHGNSLSVGFVGGHVLSSSDPTREPWWRWSFQPE
ncbi:MAG: type II secretion system protein [Phycisphaerae bacterium]